MPLALATCLIVLLVPVISLLAYNKDMGFQETWYKYTATYYVALGMFWILYRYIRITGKSLVYLGKISYSIYLFGFIVEEALFLLFGDRLFALPVHVVIALTIGITIVLSALVYRFVEAPAIALGKSIADFGERQRFESDFPRESALDRIGTTFIVDASKEQNKSGIAPLPVKHS